MSVRGDDATPVWLVSTRDAPHCGGADESLQALRCWRLEDDCRWTPAETEALFGDLDAAALPTVVYLHGNLTDASGAVMKGLAALDAIRACTCDRPFRYVIWSWPADRICRRIGDDTRLKVAYCDADAFYLAQWLNRLPRDEKVCLVGHSFGPRIITGALHLLAGGELCGRRLPPEVVSAWSEGRRNTVRAVLLAAALDADCLAPAGGRVLALAAVDRMLITCNDCDRMLRWYPRIFGPCGSEALGSVGPCCLGDQQRVEVIDVAATVGKTHDWRCYSSASNVCSRWARYVFMED